MIAFIAPDHRTANAMILAHFPGLHKEVATGLLRFSRDGEIIGKVVTQEKDLLGETFSGFVELFDSPRELVDLAIQVIASRRIPFYWNNRRKR